jgi:hypothetical protein
VAVVLKDNGGTANGGQDASPSQIFNIIVGSANVPPSFNKGTDITVNEDSGAQVISAVGNRQSWPGPTNEVVTNT